MVQQVYEFTYLRLFLGTQNPVRFKIKLFVANMVDI